MVKSFGLVVLTQTTKRAFSPMTLFLCIVYMSSFACLAAVTKMLFTVATWTPEMWVVVIAGSVTAIATALNAFFTNQTNNRIREAQALRELQREEDSKERKQVAIDVAKEVKETAKEVKAEVAKAAKLTKDAHDDIKQELVMNTEVNKEAIKVANGHNEKIASLTEQVAQTVAIVVQAPAHVIVDNTPDHSIPVHQEPNK